MNAHRAQSRAKPLVDPFGRAITYVRVSVTDRCDFRCVYCMSEDMNFLPKRDVLSLEELDRLCSAFVGLGARKIRITGGEPLVRRGMMSLFRGLSRHLTSGALDELTLTTNGSQLARFAGELADCGVSGSTSRSTRSTRTSSGRSRAGATSAVYGGDRRRGGGGPRGQDQRRRAQGLQRGAKPSSSSRWAHGRGFDMTFIEVMPLGAMERDRCDQYLPLTELRADLGDGADA